MARAYHLAIDIGAGSGRAISGWLENGVMRMEELPPLYDRRHGAARSACAKRLPVAGGNRVRAWEIRFKSYRA